MSDLEYENTFLKQHGMLPQQAIDRIAKLERELKDYETSYGKSLRNAARYLAIIRRVEALIPDWREYALDGTLGSAADDCADDLEVALTEHT